MPAVAPRLQTLIADDHPAMTSFLSDFLAIQPGVIVAGVVHTGPEVLQFCAKQPIDFLILDLGLPGLSGLEVLAALQADFPSIRTLVFSALSSERVIRSALDMGARGFVEKTATVEELAEALTLVPTGQTYMGPEIRAAMITMMHNRHRQIAMTAEELKVLRWLNQGVHNKAIADQLGMSSSGTYKMIDRVKAKLGVKTPADLIFAGIQYGVTLGA